MSFLCVTIFPIGIPKFEVSGNIINCVCEAFLTYMCSLYVFLILHHFPYKTWTLKSILFTENALCSAFSWNRRSGSGKEDLFVVIVFSIFRCWIRARTFIGNCVIPCGSGEEFWKLMSINFHYNSLWKMTNPFM